MTEADKVTAERRLKPGPGLGYVGRETEARGRQDSRSSGVLWPSTPAQGQLWRPSIDTLKTTHTYK